MQGTVFILVTRTGDDEDDDNDDDVDDDNYDHVKQHGGYMKSKPIFNCLVC
jgi:hypothetical protein